MFKDVAEMLKSSDESGVFGLLNICNAVVKQGKMQDDWKKSWMGNVYKVRGCS